MADRRRRQHKERNSRVLWNNRERSNNRDEWNSREVVLLSNHNAALAMLGASNSELNACLMQRELNVRCDQRNSSREANVLRRHNDRNARSRRHSHRSDAW